MTVPVASLRCRRLLAPARRRVRPPVAVLRWLSPCRVRPLASCGSVWRPVRICLMMRRLGSRVRAFVW